MNSGAGCDTSPNRWVFVEHRSIRASASWRKLALLPLVAAAFFIFFSGRPYGAEDTLTLDLLLIAAGSASAASRLAPPTPNLFEPRSAATSTPHRTPSREPRPVMSSKPFEYKPLRGVK
jgi:hypothetical protein